MKPTRREFAKLTSFAIAAAFLPFTLLTGCGVDSIIAGLNIGLSVLTAASGIAGLSPAIALTLQMVGTVISDVTKGYQDYESAIASLKPGKLSILEGIITTAQADLSKLLNDASVKNPELLSYITEAVAVANSAIMALVNKLGASTKAKVAAAHGSAKPLPTIPNAKSAQDLKKAWNDAVKAEHPEAVIQ